MRFRFATIVCRLLQLVVIVSVVADVTASNLVSRPRIADVNMLLPPKMTYPVEYMLLGSDGCFKWSWDHHELISVQPVYNFSIHCSTSTRVKSIAPYSGRKETTIYATDVHTGLVIRCKVYIDRFLRIQIFHNSIKLDLDGLATLRVRAFDSEDNIFSSLVGLQFKWQLIPENDDSAHRLEHIPLKNSPLSDCGGDLETQTNPELSSVYFHPDVKGVSCGRALVQLSTNLGQQKTDYASGRLVEVDVECEPPVEPTSKFTFPSDPSSIFLVTVVVLILTVLLLFFMERPRIRTRQSHIRSTPSISKPITPHRSSPSPATNGQSPRTPQPFVEFLRHTIDETTYNRTCHTPSIARPVTTQQSSHSPAANG